MEIFSNLPEELQGVVMSYTRGMWNATPAQLRLFKTCEPRHQQVYLMIPYRTKHIIDIGREEIGRAHV